MRVRFRAALNTRMSARELRPVLLRYVFRKMATREELRPVLVRVLLRYPDLRHWVKKTKLLSCLPSWRRPLEEACPICCELANEQDGVKLPTCSHSFHRDCLGQWLEKSPRLDCPCCRQLIKP